MPAQTIRRIDVGDTTLPLADDGGDGPPVLFVHGAVADLRLWDRHRALLGGRHRGMALTLRYHGLDPWAEGWPPYGVGTHADDLIAVLEQLGPVHVAAWSYSGQVVLDVALRRPDLVRSALVHEPGVPSAVTDPSALAAWRAAAAAAFAPVEAALAAGDDVAAMTALLDSSGGGPDYVASQPAASRRVQVENARTVRLLFAQQPPPRIGPAELADLAVPVRITLGERSGPLYAVPAAAMQVAIATATHRVVPGAGHMWPDEDPAAFSDAVVALIAEVGSPPGF
ncbi:alpha/beta fold hydrolase [Euzebya sp.]|uniref:alpha/beta fold hydrolase n=1 Tax=Euzebya sp. TaxID=1971409 RepID=UPI0035131932